MTKATTKIVLLAAAAAAVWWLLSKTREAAETGVRPGQFPGY